MKEKGNNCGIVGLSVGWLFPIAGLILGIIALSRKEKTIAIGVISIIESIVCWFIWFLILM